MASQGGEISSQRVYTNPCTLKRLCALYVCNNLELVFPQRHQSSVESGEDAALPSLSHDIVELLVDTQLELGRDKSPQKRHLPQRLMKQLSRYPKETLGQQLADVHLSAIPYISSQIVWDFLAEQEARALTPQQADGDSEGAAGERMDSHTTPASMDSARKETSKAMMDTAPDIAPTQAAFGLLELVAHSGSKTESRGVRVHHQDTAGGAATGLASFATSEEAFHLHDVSVSHVQRTQASQSSLGFGSDKDGSVRDGSLESASTTHSQPDLADLEEGVVNLAQAVQGWTPASQQQSRLLLKSFRIHGCDPIRRGHLPYLIDHPMQRFECTDTQLSWSFFVVASYYWRDTLHTLNLSGCSRLKTQRMMDAIGNLQQLTHLDISGTSVSLFPRLPKLKTLIAAGSRVSDRQIMLLAVHSPHVERLDLATTSITAAAIEHLGTFANLKTLSIAECKRLRFGPGGMVHGQAQLQLATALNRDIFNFSTTSLTSLDVSRCAVMSDFVLRALEAYPTLKYIGVGGLIDPPELPGDDLLCDCVVGSERLGPHQAVAFTANTSLYSPQTLLTGFRAVCTFLSHQQAQGRSDIPTESSGLIKLAVRVLWHYSGEEDVAGALRLIASAVIYYGTRQPCRSQQTRREVIYIIKYLLAWSPTQQIVQNLCYTLRNFIMETELAPYASELSETLFSVIDRFSTNPSVRAVAVRVCAYWLAALSPPKKLEVVKHGAVKKSLGWLNELLLKDDLDEDEVSFVENSWTFLWNLTDETPETCWRVINHNGIETIKRTLKRYGGGSRIHRNVMGVVANLADVDDIVSQFDKPFFELLLQYVSQHAVDPEVSYNIIEVFARTLMLSLHGTDLDLNHLHRVIVDTVDGWGTDLVNRWIHYRSLWPLEAMLHSHLPWAVQYWAAWAVHSLCSDDEGRYIPMILEQDVAARMLELLRASKPRVCHICRLTLTKVKHFLVTNTKFVASISTEMIDHALAVSQQQEEDKDDGEVGVLRDAHGHVDDAECECDFGAVGGKEQLDLEEDVKESEEYPDREEQEYDLDFRDKTTAQQHDDGGGVDDGMALDQSIDVADDGDDGEERSGAAMDQSAGD
eukprot:m.24014 g.24014  ORF g.24014 m.24014 type:complete len:1090 (+) comp8555_c0_seq1:56-3325(+)